MGMTKIPILTSMNLHVRFPYKQERYGNENDYIIPLCCMKIPFDGKNVEKTLAILEKKE